jgi:hypothetical protein
VDQLLDLYPEFRAILGVAYAERAAHVNTDNGHRHVQADPASIVRSLGGEVRVENLAYYFCRNAARVVGDGYHSSAVFLKYADPYHLPVASPFVGEGVPGIDENIEKRRGKLVRIAVDGGIAFRMNIDADLQVSEAPLVGSGQSN